MLPLIEAECVGAGWVNKDQFAEGLAAASALPGPIATKMAVLVGYQEAGVGGAVAAVSGVVLPSAVLMGVLGAWLMQHRDNRWVAAALAGVKPAIVGMLAFVAWDLAPVGVTSAGTALVAVAAFVALVYKVHPAAVIVASVAFGVLVSRAS